MFSAFLSHSGKLFANVNICSFLHAVLWFNQQGCNEGARRRNYPGAESLWRRWITAVGPNDCGLPTNPNNVTRTFFNTVHSLPKDLRFEYGGAKLASCPGRHLTSLRPWLPPSHIFTVTFWKHSVTNSLGVSLTILGATTVGSSVTFVPVIHWYRWINFRPVCFISLLFSCIERFYLEVIKHRSVAGRVQKHCPTCPVDKSDSPMHRPMTALKR